MEACCGFMTDIYSSHIVHPDQLSASDRGRWDDFCLEDHDLSKAFLSLSYVLAASRIFRDVRVCVIKRSGQVVAFFPFQFRSLGHRLLGYGERIGGELSDYFGLVAAVDVVLSPLQLVRLAGLNALLFTHLDESQSRYGLTGSNPQTGLLINLDKGGDAYWSEIKQADKRFFNDTERRVRKLVETHGPLHLVYHHENPVVELDRLIDLKRQQYARTGADDVLKDGRIRQFLGLLAQSEDPLCRGVVSTLYAGDTWVASHFGLQHRSVLHFWFPVYNLELQNYSPGRVLITEIIKQADALGITRIDRGVGDSQAKRDFANGEHTFLRGLWQQPNASALVIRVGLFLQWRMETIPRRLVGSIKKLVK